MTPLTDYTDTYKEGGIYDDLAYGSPGPSRGLRFSKWLSPVYPRGAKVLCVGCGNGFEVVSWLKDGKDAYGTELHKIDVPILKNRIIHCLCPDLPFKDNEFDLLVCCEVLEHIEEELTEPIIEECGRVAKDCFFSLATRGDPPWNTHINIHDIGWWFEKFSKYFDIKNIQYKPQIAIPFDIDGNFKLFKFQYPDGIIMYGSKSIQKTV